MRRRGTLITSRKGQPCAPGVSHLAVIVPCPRNPVVAASLGARITGTRGQGKTSLNVQTVKIGTEAKRKEETRCRTRRERSAASWRRWAGAKGGRAGAGQGKAHTRLKAHTLQKAPARRVFGWSNTTKSHLLHLHNHLQRQRSNGHRMGKATVHKTRNTCNTGKVIKSFGCSNVLCVFCMKYTRTTSRPGPLPSKLPLIVAIRRSSGTETASGWRPLGHKRSSTTGPCSIAYKEPLLKRRVPARRHLKSLSHIPRLQGANIC
jgi:hypothetical protein